MVLISACLLACLFHLIHPSRFFLPASAFLRHTALCCSAPLSLLYQALALCPQDDPQVAVVYNNLAATLEARAMPREAEALYLQAIAVGERTLPEDHPRLKHIRSKLKTLQATLMPFPGLPKEVAAAQVAKTVALVAPAGDDFVSE